MGAKGLRSSCERAARNSFLCRSASTSCALAALNDCFCRCSCKNTLTLLVRTRSSRGLTKKSTAPDSYPLKTRASIVESRGYEDDGDLARTLQVLISSAR